MSKPIDVFVDTDIGVDDAVAIAWLLRHPAANVLGFTTVAGNTSHEHAARNLLTLLQAAGISDLPVTIGAAEPLVGSACGTGPLIHGPDGFWLQQAPYDITGLPNDAPAAIANAARAHPGMTLLALGPMTNLAQTLQRFPQDLVGVRIIALAGGHGVGNVSPVAEFNAFCDPHALEILLSSGLDITLIPMNAFDKLKVEANRLPEQLIRAGDSLGKLLSAVLTPYLQLFGHAGERPSIPDLVGAIYTLRPDLASVRSGLVAVELEGRLTRGQTVMGFTPADKLMLLADIAELSVLAERSFGEPDFDLAAAMEHFLSRRADNAKVVLDIDEQACLRELYNLLVGN